MGLAAAPEPARADDDEVVMPVEGVVILLDKIARQIEDGGLDGPGAVRVIRDLAVRVWIRSTILDAESACREAARDVH